MAGSAAPQPLFRSFVWEGLFYPPFFLGRASTITAQDGTLGGRRIESHQRKQVERGAHG